MADPSSQRPKCKVCGTNSNSTSDEWRVMGPFEGHKLSEDSVIARRRSMAASRRLENRVA